MFSCHRRATGAASHPGEAGFTLLELLIAMTLMAFIAVLMFGAIRFGARAWQRSEAVTAQVDDVGVTQALLRRLIAAAYPMFIADPTQPRVDFEGTSDRLSVLAPLPDALETGGMGRFTLLARERDGQTELDLAWRPELARSGDITHAETLLTGVARVDLAYFGSSRPTGAPSWHDRWSEQRAMPQLVRVTIEFPQGDSRIWPDLIIAPRLTVDQGCLYDPVTRLCRGR